MRPLSGTLTKAIDSRAAAAAAVARAFPPDPGTNSDPLPSVAPLPAAEPMACPPLRCLRCVLVCLAPGLVTAWGGQMTDATFGETFVFSGTPRPETLFGLGFNRRLMDADPFAIEFDGNALSLGQLEPIAAFATPAAFLIRKKIVRSLRPRTFGKAPLGIGLRWWIQPWLSFGVVKVSASTVQSVIMKRRRGKTPASISQLLSC